MYGFSSTERTANAPSRAAASVRAASSSSASRSPLSSPVSSKSRPWATACRRPDERRLERAGVERADEVPVRRGDEAHALALALDDEPHRDRLHAACREARRRPSSTAPARPRSRRAGRGSGASPARRRGRRRSRGSASARWIASFVISWNTRRLTGTFGLQDLEQMPGDRLAFAVFVRRERSSVESFSRLQLVDLLLLVRVNDVERLEVVLDVDARRAQSPSSPRPGCRGAFGQVADVADGGFHE